jgi:MbtH protein
MIGDEREDHLVYLVVSNREAQYSIWPKHKPVPRGWQSMGKEGQKVECLQYIETVWTDMSPLSLRQFTKSVLPKNGSTSSSDRTSCSAHIAKDARGS